MRETYPRVSVPKSEQPDKSLSGARRVLPQRCKFGRRLRVEHLLARLVELVQRTGLAEFQRKLGRGFRCGLCIGKQSDEFVGRDRTIVGPSDFGCEPQRLLGSAQLCLLESLAGDFRSKWQRGQSENVADHLPLDLECAVSGNPRNREGRIGRQAFSDQIGFGQRQFVVRSLQAPIVQERDLDGGVDRQASAEKALYGGIGPLRIVLRANGNHFLMDYFAGQVGDNRHASIRRERRASGKEQGRKKQRRRCGAKLTSSTRQFWTQELSLDRSTTCCCRSCRQNPPASDIVRSKIVRPSSS